MLSSRAMPCRVACKPHAQPVGSAAPEQSKAGGRGAGSGRRRGRRAAYLLPLLLVLRRLQLPSQIQQLSLQGTAEDRWAGSGSENLELVAEAYYSTQQPAVH